ncbi:hypothetical protein E8E11_009823 [Didymella keratinophila]|nr:hypothetical protein E8E11_009823 [Didymella keratinophila]
MFPGDIGDVPTLSSLNKPQKRALILRDQLRYLEPAHLDRYLDGITADEPPTYKHINGTVCPPLAQVTIKDDATRFDLGNVQFPEEGGVTYRAYLTVEDGRFEMRTEDPLPKNDAELASVSIHRFVAENMSPLFKAKYKAIHARMEKINEARRVAYNMLDHPPAKFEDGETVARLNPANTRKRKEIVKHASNKRQRVGLETIPKNIKSETFDAIPAQVKVNLFDNIIKTAFPNFDNLIVASWNVVSIYANVGSDFPELHTAIVDLKGALEEFESAYAPSRTKSGKSKKESTPVQQNGGSAGRTSTPVKEPRGTPVPAATSHIVTASPKKEENGATDERYQDDEDDSQHQMPPPRFPQVSQSQHDDRLQEDERQPEPPATAQIDRSIARAQSVPHLVPETRPPTSRSTPSSTPPSPNEQHLAPSRERVRKIRDRSVDTRAPPAPGSELMRKRQEYTASLSKANRNQTGAAMGHRTQHDDDDEQDEDLHDHTHHEHAHEQRVSDPRRPGSGGGHGAKKQMGSAPVAPMMHIRKDGGVNGAGGGRRGY